MNKKSFWGNCYNCITNFWCCAAAPFKYKRDQIVSWAGPNVLFRFDNVEADVKWFSVREIAALP